MNILSIIPARGGSKELPGKNIKMLNGKPLIAYTIEASLECSEIARTIVSTDCEEIALVAKGYGAEVPFLRPMVLSSDTATSIDVVKHCLDFLRNGEGYVPDYVCLLQCTSPLRRTCHIVDAIKILNEKGAESIASVCRADKNPYWAKRINSRGTLTDLIEQEHAPTARQGLPEVFNLNGAIYINKTAFLYNHNLFVNEHTYPYIMEKLVSVDIDDSMDFMVCEMLMKQEMKSL